MTATDNPVHQAKRLATAPRCTAMAKTTRGRCKGPAVRGWNVCRIHGARGGAPFGPANGRWPNGARTKATEALARTVAELVRQARTTATAMGGG
jgi:hypothetical protein